MPWVENGTGPASWPDSRRKMVTGFGLGAGLEDEAGELREGVDGFREGGDNLFYLCDFGVEVGGFSKSRASEAASRWAVSWVRRLCRGW